MEEMDIQTHTKAVFEPTKKHLSSCRFAMRFSLRMYTKNNNSWIDSPKAWIPIRKHQRPDSQQSTGSQIIICMKIYCKINKTVKSAHEQTFKGTYLIKGRVYVIFLLFSAL